MVLVLLLPSLSSSDKSKQRRRDGDSLLTVLLVGGVGEEEHSVFLQSSSCHCRIHQRVVKVQIVYGQGQSAVVAAHHHAAPTVVVVLVPHIDDDAAVHHLNGLQRGREGGKGLAGLMLCGLNGGRRKHLLSISD